MDNYELDGNALKADGDILNKKSSATEEIFDWLESIIFAVFVVILIFTFIFRIARVDGTSMNPTLINDDKLIVSNMFYTPENQDVVVVYSEGLDKAIVKRVIATEGQKIKIDFESGDVFVDGQKLYEHYINNLTHEQEDFFEVMSEYGNNEDGYTIPNGYVFLLGDNRGVSKDSRSSEVGLIPTEDVIGKVLLRIYPFNTFGSIE